METGAARMGPQCFVQVLQPAIDLNNARFVRRYNELVFAYVIGC